MPATDGVRRPDRAGDTAGFFGNALSLIGTSALTLPLGLVFWLVAARWFSADAMGLATAAVSAMLLLSAVSALGLGTFLIGELPRHPQRAAHLIATSCAIAGTAGMTVGMGFASLAWLLSANLGALGDSPAAAVLFGSGVALTTITLILDQAAVGLFRGAIQFWRNVILALSKLGILVLFVTALSTRSWMIIYGSWALSTALSVGFVIAVAASAGSRPLNWRVDLRLALTFRAAAGWHHALNIALQAPPFALPVVATAILGPTEGAYFYAAWMIGSLTFVVPMALTSVLFAAGAARPDRVPHRIRQTLLLSGSTGVVAAAGAMTLGLHVLGLFGSSYSTQGDWTLRVVAVASLPLIVRYHYVALLRINGLVKRGASLMAFVSTGEVAAAAVGGSIAGARGLILGWAVAVLAQVAVMLPRVARAARTGSVV